jgi:hypothetical protein
MKYQISTIINTPKGDRKNAKVALKKAANRWAELPTTLDYGAPPHRDVLDDAMGIKSPPRKKEPTITSRLRLIKGDVLLNVFTKPKPEYPYAFVYQSVVGDKWSGGFMSLSWTELKNFGPYDFDADFDPITISSMQDGNLINLLLEGSAA